MILSRENSVSNQYYGLIIESGCTAHFKRYLKNMIMNVGTRCLGSQLESLSKFLGHAPLGVPHFPSSNKEISYLLNFYTILESLQTSALGQDPKISQEINLEILNGFIALLEKDPTKTAEIYSSYIAEQI